MVTVGLWHLREYLAKFLVDDEFLPDVYALLFCYDAPSAPREHGTFVQLVMGDACVEFAQVLQYCSFITIDETTLHRSSECCTNSCCSKCYESRPCHEVCNPLLGCASTTIVLLLF